MSEMEAGRGVKDWIQTFTGEKFFPLSPRHSDLVLEDVAHALSLICRYTGHCCRFYSVAEHSVLVSQEVERRAIAEGKDWRAVRDLARWGLMHDASEAYIADVSRPIKRLPAFEQYREAEARLQGVIAERFGLLAGGEPELVKAVDVEILSNEVSVLMPQADVEAWGKSWPEGKLPSPIPNIYVQGLSPESAERAFRDRFNALWTGQCY